MCGFVLDAGAAEPEPEEKRSSRVRQRTMSKPNSELALAAEKIREESSSGDYSAFRDEGEGPTEGYPAEEYGTDYSNVQESQPQARGDENPLEEYLSGGDYEGDVAETQEEKRREGPSFFLRPVEQKEELIETPAEPPVEDPRAAVMLEPMVTEAEDAQPEVIHSTHSEAVQPEEEPAPPAAPPVEEKRFDARFEPGTITLAEVADEEVEITSEATPRDEDAINIEERLEAVLSAVVAGASASEGVKHQEESVETKPQERAVEAEQVDNSVETKAADTRPSEVKPSEIKPSEIKPSETKPLETKAVEPEEAKPAESKSVEPPPEPATPPTAQIAQGGAPNQKDDKRQFRVKLAAGARPLPRTEPPAAAPATAPAAPTPPPAAHRPAGGGIPLAKQLRTEEGAEQKKQGGDQGGRKFGGGLSFGKKRDDRKQGGEQRQGQKPANAPTPQPPVQAAPVKEAAPEKSLTEERREMTEEVRPMESAPVVEAIPQVEAPKEVSPYSDAPEESLTFEPAQVVEEEPRNESMVGKGMDKVDTDAPKKSEPLQFTPRPADKVAGRLFGWLVSYLESDGKAVELREGKFFVTSMSLKASDLVIEDRSISTPHAMIHISPEQGFLVQDLMSERGVFIRRRGSDAYRREEETVKVYHGDWIRFGDVEFLVTLIAHLGQK